MNKGNYILKGKNMKKKEMVQDILDAIGVVMMVLSGALLLFTFLAFILVGITPVFIRLVISTIILSLFSIYFLRKGTS